MKNIFLVLAGVAFTLLAAGCGGGGTGGAAGASEAGIASELEQLLPDTSLPEGPPNAALFGTWTFKTAVATHNCDPGMFDPSVSEQEIRIIQLPFACELSSWDENGNSLEAANNSIPIFDVQNTHCGAGGDILVLGSSDGGELFPGCSVNFNMVARLTLTGGKLVGPLVGTIDFEGDQCGLSDCHASTQLEGTRGANIQGGYAYMLPPPGLVPVNPAPQGGGAGGGAGGGGGGAAPQPAPQPQPVPQPQPAPAPQPAPQPQPQPQPGGAPQGGDPQGGGEEEGVLIINEPLPEEEAEEQPPWDIDIYNDTPWRDPLPKYWEFNGF